MAAVRICPLLPVIAGAEHRARASDLAGELPVNRPASCNVVIKISCKQPAKAWPKNTTA